MDAYAKKNREMAAENGRLRETRENWEAAATRLTADLKNVQTIRMAEEAEIERLSAESRSAFKAGYEQAMDDQSRGFRASPPEGKEYTDWAFEEWQETASTRQDCCQYHKDGGDPYAACCDTEPRERHSV